MKLLTVELVAALPAIGSTEDVPLGEKVAVAKFFTPWAGWTWFVVEGKPSGDDYYLFGLVLGTFPEWGFFTTAELEAVRGPGGLRIERDVFFRPRPMHQCGVPSRLLDF